MERIKKLLEKKPVFIRFNIGVALADVPKVKEYLEPYAKELSWIIETEEIKEERTGRTFKLVIMKPKGGSISWNTLNSLWESLHAYSLRIHSDLISKQERTTLLSREGISEKEATNTLGETVMFDLMFYNFGNLLSVNYELTERLDLERKNPEIALKLFGESTEHLLSHSIKNKEYKKQIAKEYNLKLVDIPICLDCGKLLKEGEKVRYCERHRKHRKNM